VELNSSYETVQVSRESGIAWVVLNRPAKRNAMNPILHEEMVAVLRQLEMDDQSSVLVLTGAGESFSAGQDLREYFRDLEDKPVERTRAYAASLEWTWNRLSNFPKPTIAMVNGYCFGGAFTPLIACDLAIAADDAVFGLSEINWGVYPGGLVTKVVADTIPYRDALLYIMTGRTFTGAEAAAMRLVTFSVPRNDLRAATVALAEELMSKNLAALRAAKEAYRACRTMDYAQAYEYMSAKTIALRATDVEGGRTKGLSQFLDEKAYRPGRESYRRNP
jgi:trans-feruloyl-CoA hydratase/vanillin synthase